MMELSIIMPTAMMSPDREMILSDTLHTAKKMKVMMTAEIMLMPMMSGERTLRMKRNTTTKMSRKPKMRFSCRLEMV